MKKSIVAVAIVLALVLSPVMVMAKGSYGGGFRSSSSFSSGGSFGGGFKSSGSSYGGGFGGSSYKSSGSFSGSTGSYGGGLKTPVGSSGSFSTPRVSTPPIPKVKTETTVNGTTYTTRAYNATSHENFVVIHPYAYYYNPFSSNWFFWWWMFGNNYRAVSEKHVDCAQLAKDNKTDPSCPATTEIKAAK